MPARQAIVEIDLADGQTVRHHAKAVRGTPDNPMTTQEIDDKALDLMAPIIGEERAGKLVAAVRTIEHAALGARPAAAAAGVIRYCWLCARIFAARSTSGFGVHRRRAGTRRSPRR